MTQYVVTHFGLDGLDEDNDEDADDEIVETHIRTFNNGDDFDTKKTMDLFVPIEGCTITCSAHYSGFV